jgi:hypothetical protein
VKSRIANKCLYCYYVCSLDWGPPATPLNLAVGDNSTPQEGEHSTGLDQEKSLNTEANVCNGDVQNRTTVPDISKPASKKPIGIC